MCLFLRVREKNKQNQTKNRIQEQLKYKIAWIMENI